MERRLEPFLPETICIDVLTLNQLVLLDEFEKALGIKKTKSKQWNFITNPQPDRYIILVHNSDTKVDTIPHPNLIACAFGTYSHGNLELWHINVVKDHPVNDSQRGSRWGVYGIEKVIKNGKVRWSDVVTGTNLTMRNHEKYVFGSANPYAVGTVYMFASHFEPSLNSITQNPDMPCAQLFHSNYDHTTHPAIQLIYKSLGFVKSPMNNYVWYKSSMPPLIHSFRLFLQRMKSGLDGV